MKVVFRAYAWAVEFGNDCRALILEEPRAIQYAASSHGIIKPLYERVEIPEEPTDEVHPVPAG